MWLDCIIKCVSAEELGIEAQGMIAKIIVYLNGLPFSGTVRMCNHREISVQNELAGLSKQKAQISSRRLIWNWYSPQQEPQGLQSVLFLYLISATLQCFYHVYPISNIVNACNPFTF